MLFMKKNLYIFCSIFFIYIGSCFWVSLSTHADCSGTCKIQDAPAPALEKYLDNVWQIIRTVGKSVSDAHSEETSSNNESIIPKSISKQTSSIQNSILASMSQIINFSGYFSSFDFYIALPMTQEVPYPIKRDHQRLQRETERLTNMLQKITKRWYAWTPIENPCQWISETCSLSWNARSVLVDVIKNHKYIVGFYRLSINDSAYVSSRKYILVNDNFESEMEQYYNKTILTDCSQCEWGFMDRMNESIDKISNLNTEGFQGIRKWKEAWAQITWAVWQSIKTQQEDKLLREYLSTQGVSWDAAESVTNNLEKYNSGGLSTSNPLFNSANYTFGKAKEKVDSFTQWAIQNYLDTDQEEIPIVIINTTTDEVETTQSIEATISGIYEKQLLFAPVQDTGTQKLISKIIRMHYNLVEAINNLDATIKTSEKVCDSQGQGQWKCTYR